MKRFLTTGFLGAILGIVIGGAPAGASLISRSFLDQALTDYATTTALDLKANKADLTDLSDKIGTLPSGSLLNQTRFTDVLYKFTQGTESPVYPNSMAELVKQIYGEFSSSGNQPGLLHNLITGFPNNGILPGDSPQIGILPAMSLAESASSVANTVKETATAAKTAADANTAKIGTLPDGYETVGAALTAMKSDIDAKNLPSTSDDGQYVLSAKKVGDTVTYTWVRMDLTSEEQAQ